LGNLIKSEAKPGTQHQLPKFPLIIYPVTHDACSLGIGHILPPQRHETSPQNSCHDGVHNSPLHKLASPKTYLPRTHLSRPQYHQASASAGESFFASGIEVIANNLLDASLDKVGMDEADLSIINPQIPFSSS